MTAVTAVRRDTSGDLHAGLTDAPALGGRNGEPWQPDRVQVTLNRTGRPGKVALRGGNASVSWRLGGYARLRPGRRAPAWVQSIADEVLRQVGLG